MLNKKHVEKVSSGPEKAENCTTILFRALDYVVAFKENNENC